MFVCIPGPQGPLSLSKHPSPRGPAGINGNPGTPGPMGPCGPPGLGGAFIIGTPTNGLTYDPVTTELTLAGAEVVVVNPHAVVQIVSTILATSRGFTNLATTSLTVRLLLT